MASKLAVLCVSVVSVAAVDPPSVLPWPPSYYVLLSRTPFVMTHDAATGYLRDGLVNAWTKTQSTPFAGQLECGARAFDARAYLDKKDGLIWHHGAVKVDHQVSESLSEIISWCNENPSELVILPFSDCEGEDGCMDAVVSALASANIVNLNSCDGLDGLTYGAAKQMAALPGGGALLALTAPNNANGVACSYGNYDPSQDCISSDGANATEDALSKDCWDSPASIPYDRMLTQLDGVSAGGLRDNAFTQFQGLWQEDAQSVTYGTARFSSLLSDEKESGLNGLLTSEILNGRWPATNMFEVNNICDGGVELLAALRKMQATTAVVV